jgi:hypothetical protein
VLLHLIEQRHRLVTREDSSAASSVTGSCIIPCIDR